MRFIWAGLLTLFSIVVVSLAVGMTFSSVEGSEPGITKALDVTFSALFAAHAPLSLWAAWRLVRTRLPFWDAVYRPLIAGLALFSLLLAGVALAIFVDGAGKGGSGLAAHLFIGTLPLAGMSAIAAWSAYRHVSVGAVWDALRNPALAGATLGSATLVLWGVAAPIDAARSDSDFAGLAVGFAIVIVTFPSFVLAALGFTVALKLVRTSEISITFGRWATSAVLAGVFFVSGFAALLAQLPTTVTWALWSFMLFAGLQMVRGSQWGTTAVLAIGFLFSGLGALGLPSLVPLALLGLTLLSGVQSVRGSLGARAEA